VKLFSKEFKNYMSMTGVHQRQRQAQKQTKHSHALQSIAR